MSVYTPPNTKMACSNDFSRSTPPATEVATTDPSGLRSAQFGAEGPNETLGLIALRTMPATAGGIFEAVTC